MELAKQLDRIHRNIEKNFKIEKDKKIAQDLTIFFNALIYGNQQVNENNMKSVLKKILTNQTIQNIVSLNPELSNGYFQQGWQETEIGFSAIILQLINTSINNELSTLDLNKNNKDIKIINVGSQYRSVPVDLSFIPNEARKQMVQKLREEHTRLVVVDEASGLYRFALKQGKNDIDTSGYIIEGKLSPEAQALMNLTASVKHYKGFVIHLEKVNVLKAYAANVSQLKNISTTQAENLYYKYYKTKEFKYDTEITAHLDHLIKTYALTGYGQVNRELSLTQFSRFLIVNNYEAKQVKVVSTSAVVRDLFNNKATGFLPTKTISENNIIDVMFKV